jgi:hypothetical protein
MNPSCASRFVLPSLRDREARKHEETPLPGSTSGSTGKRGKHEDEQDTRKGAACRQVAATAPPASSTPAAAGHRRLPVDAHPGPAGADVLRLAAAGQAPDRPDGRPLSLAGAVPKLARTGGTCPEPARLRHVGPCGATSWPVGLCCAPGGPRRTSRGRPAAASETAAICLGCCARRPTCGTRFGRRTRSIADCPPRGRRKLRYPKRLRATDCGVADA